MTVTDETQLITALGGAEGISGRPHSEHGFDAWCPVCTGDSKAIAAVLAPICRTETDVKLEALQEAVEAFRSAAEASATRDGRYELTNLADLLDDRRRELEAKEAG